MAATTEDNYQLLLKQAQALVEGENDWIANTANISIKIRLRMRQ